MHSTSHWLSQTDLKIFTSFRPVRDWGLSLIFAGLPLLDERQEFRLAGYVFPQHLGNVETLRGLVILKNTAERALGCTYCPRISNLISKHKIK